MDDGAAEFARELGRVVVEYAQATTFSWGFAARFPSPRRSRRHQPAQTRATTTARMTPLSLTTTV